MSNEMEIRMPFYKFREMEISLEKKQQFIEEWCKSENVVLVEKEQYFTLPKITYTGKDKIIKRLERNYKAAQEYNDQLHNSLKIADYEIAKNIRQIDSLQKEIEELKKKKSWF